MSRSVIFFFFFFFQAEDGIRDAQESRGLGDVYKRQDYWGYLHVALAVLVDQAGLELRDPAASAPP